MTKFLLVLASKQASWFIAASKQRKMSKSSNIRFYEMLNGEADRREACSLTRQTQPNYPSLSIE